MMQPWERYLYIRAWARRRKEGLSREQACKKALATVRAARSRAGRKGKGWAGVGGKGQ